MPDYRHRKKKAKDKQKTPRKEKPFVNYDMINIEVGKMMRENERKRKVMLKDAKEQMKNKY